MERAIRQSVVVGVGGRIEMNAPDLAPGTRAEAILLVDEPEDAEREALVEAILLGEDDVQAGNVRPAADFFQEHTHRYAVSD